MSPALPTPSEASHAARYEALLRVLHLLTAQRHPTALFRVLARELRQVVTCDGISLALYDAAVRQHYFHALEIGPQPGVVPLADVPVEETMTWWVYQHQQPLVIPAVDTETRFPQLMALLKTYGIQSACGLPLTTVHRRLGGLCLGSASANAYSEEEVCFLSLVADHVALVIDDALNFEAAQREKDRLELLLDLTNNLVSNLELRDLLRAISASVRRVMRCDGVGVLLPDAAGHQLRVYALDYPDSKGFIQEETLVPIEGSLPGKAFQTGKPVVVGRPDPTQVSPEDYRLIAGEGLQSSCLLPLISRNRCLGVLGLGRQPEHAFRQEEVEFLTQVARQVAIAVENALAYGEIAALKDQLAQEKLYLEDEIRSEMYFEDIVGTSAALRRVLHQVETVAPTDATVLIYGETGTGKELIARAIHHLSTRRQHAFVKLNCAAIPTGLLESELFGHEKGAFTGAVTQRIGRFELANRGTIFLDEIGEIPLEVQPKLLRVLQEREFERLGSPRTLRTDARLIAATNRDLAAMVEAQTFRADLFYRINVFPVHVPPLRERPDDIPLLVRYFAQQFARRMRKTIETIPADTMQALVQYPWPGNIRELQNVIERAVILSPGPVLQVPRTDLTPRATDTVGATVSAQGRQALPGQHEARDAARRAPIRSMLEEAERQHILRVLEETNWVVAGPHGAAVRLGMKRSTLQFRMQKLGISRHGK
jgi:formate hydrogenlyase transcriptional activator